MKVQKRLDRRLKDLVLSGMNRFGYDLVNIRPVPGCHPDFPHQRLTPNGTYAPWLADGAFQAAYENIRGNTLVDIYRCHELWQIAAQIGHLPGDYLEVGVWRGGTGCLVAEMARQRDPAGRVYLCDTFRGVANATDHDPEYSGGEHSDTSRGIVEQLVARMDLPNVEILQGIFPEETAKRVADRRFKYCHVDVDVYLSAKNVAEWVWPRLTPGGVVVFDDYGFQATSGVTKYVNETAGASDRRTIYNLNGHAVVIKLA